MGRHVPPVTGSRGDHISCAMTAVLLARVSAYGGADGRGGAAPAGGQAARSPEYLLDIVNWISYDEARALWQCQGASHHASPGVRQGGRRGRGAKAHELACRGAVPVPRRPREALQPDRDDVGQIQRRHDGSRRSAWSHGLAEIIAEPVPRDSRATHDTCDWTRGLLTQPPVLFGHGAGNHVLHEECATFGAPACVYEISWERQRRRASTDATARTAAAIARPARGDAGPPAEHVRDCRGPDRNRQDRGRAGADHGSRRIRGQGAALPAGGPDEPRWQDCTATTRASTIGRRASTAS